MSPQTNRTGFLRLEKMREKQTNKKRCGAREIAVLEKCVRAIREISKVTRKSVRFPQRFPEVKGSEGCRSRTRTHTHAVDMWLAHSSGCTSKSSKSNVSVPAHGGAVSLNDTKQARRQHCWASPSTLIHSGRQGPVRQPVVEYLAERKKVASTVCMRAF